METTANNNDNNENGTIINNNDTTDFTTSVQSEIKYNPGTVLVGFHVTGDPRWYVVVKETPCKVKVQRLKHKSIKDGEFTKDLPGTARYDKIETFTKNPKENCLTSYGMQVIIFTKEMKAAIEKSWSEYSHGTMWVGKMISACGTNGAPYII